ncbi:chromate resistance protein ChrB domain-containing protein [Noviherbaspirillum sp.]|uniref:chromate resistance protein ChrB domain-containing protein n=1 Tax=Noviherbaspirillum sp. TaxID=1926288 RepID=UPI002FE3A054
MQPPLSNWLILIATLPTASATPRMRLWRAIKALGCMPLRDGVYLLPDINGHAEALSDLAVQTNTEGGQAWVVSILPRNPTEATEFVPLFDRSQDYTGLVAQITESRKALAAQTPSEVAKTVKKLRKELESIQRIDFFPNDMSLSAQAAWADFENAANAVLSPDEPHAAQRPIPRLHPADFQGRTWATRRNLWVDRVASAWLIQRFIDCSARFLWLDTPLDCPTEALGFDFDDARFTHVGDKVTFEVLLASFGLEDNKALTKLASLVHALDVGGPPHPEAVFFEAILSGARTRLQDDDALLIEIGAVLDSLYVHYSKESST